MVIIRRMTTPRKTAQSFRVDLRVVPAVVFDQHGALVPDACVHHVSFPHRRVETDHGHLWEMVGPPVADISIADIYYRDVPVIVDASSVTPLLSQ